MDERIDTKLAALLAPPARPVDEAFAYRTAQLVALDRRLAAASRAGRCRTALGIVGAFAAAGGLSLFAAMPGVAALGGLIAPAALALMALVLLAQSPALAPADA